MGFVYTNCPDICPLITQNLIKIQKDLGYPSNVQFLGVSFDPLRDTPEILHRYKEVFKVDENVNFLTGEPKVVQKRSKSGPKVTQSHPHMPKDIPKQPQIQHSLRSFIKSLKSVWKMGVFENGPSYTQSDSTMIAK